jgi:hypothetical protein
MRQQVLTFAQLRGAARRHHCPLCHKSICSSCSDKGEEGRVCHSCRENGQPPLVSEVQYGLLRLPDENCLSLMFRGTATHTDIVIDNKTKPRDLLRHFPHLQAEGRSLLVHGGAEEQVALVYDKVKAELLAACAPAENRDMKLVLGGHSLGGAYATVLALRLLIDPETQPLMLHHDCEVLTFGAPRVIYDTGRLADGLSAALPAMSARPSTLAAVAAAAAGAAAAAAHPVAGPTATLAAASIAAPGPRRGSTAAAAAAQLHSVDAFFMNRFRVFVNESDIVPRLLGNHISALNLVAHTVKRFARSIFNVQLAPAEVETELHHFTQLGSVYALVSGRPCLHIPPGTATDKFFRVFPFGLSSAFEYHRTALYEMRLLAAWEALFKARAVVRPTPGAAVQPPAFNPSDDDLTQEPVTADVQLGLIASLTGTAHDALLRLRTSIGSFATLMQASPLLRFGSGADGNETERKRRKQAEEDGGGSGGGEVRRGRGSGVGASARRVPPPPPATSTTSTTSSSSTTTTASAYVDHRRVRVPRVGREPVRAQLGAPHVRLEVEDEEVVAVDGAVVAAEDVEVALVHHCAREDPAARRVGRELDRTPRALRGAVPLAVHVGEFREVRVGIGRVGGEELLRVGGEAQLRVQVLLERRRRRGHGRHRLGERFDVPVGETTMGASYDLGRNRVFEERSDTFR